MPNRGSAAAIGTGGLLLFVAEEGRDKRAQPRVGCRYRDRGVRYYSLQREGRHHRAGCYFLWPRREERRGREEEEKKDGT